jgi:hypothetical protein
MTNNDDCISPHPERPVALRQSVARALIAAFEADVEANAADVIREVREERPLDYLKVAISLLPNAIAVDAPNLKDVPDDRLAELIREVRHVLAARAGAAGGS